VPQDLPVGAKEFAYQWLRDGEPIKGATKKTYKLTAEDMASDEGIHLISVKVVSTKDGKSVTKTTGSLAPGAPALYRFYSSKRGSHLFTADTAERAAVVEKYTDFAYEGIAAYVLPKTKAGAEGEAVVYRFYNASKGVHFYTADPAEKDDIVKKFKEWKLEGAVFTVYSGQADGLVPVYRFYNASKGCHFFTTDKAEADNVTKTYKEWKYEGIAFYVTPA
jgi:hypothetical protein